MDFREKRVVLGAILMDFDDGFPPFQVNN